MRRTKVVTIDADPPFTRDNGKSFLLTEMASDQGEKWALRALLGICSVNPQISPDIAKAGMAGLASIGVGLLLTLPERIALPLLDEMFEQVQFKPAGPKIPPQPILDGNKSQIEEITTRLFLRQELLELHLGFSAAAAPLTTVPKPGSEKGEAA
jgi:hypothetical protein